MLDSIAAASGPQARLLVVDDDVLMCQFLLRSLQSRGFVVSCETSPVDALVRLAGEDFDVVVTDLNMEGLDGLAFSRRVTALDRGIPVILLAGAGTMELAINAVRSGAWDCLFKPVSIGRLAGSIRRALEHRRLAGQVRELRTTVAGAGPA